MRQQVGSSTTRWIGRMIIPVIAAAGFLPIGVAHADPSEVTITGYDIVDAPVSGYGGFGTTYSGSYAHTRFDTVDTFRTPSVGNYSGGTGSLADGIDSSNTLATQLFFTANRGDPEITLHLDTPTRVTSIEFYGGRFVGLALPGLLTGSSVSIGGQQLHQTTEDFGDLSVLGIPYNDRISLTATPLAAITTDTIVLSDFTVAPGWDQFSITEIKVFGNPPPADPLGVTIDISPADSKAVIDLTAGGTVPVAILSTATFDATTVDRTSVTFGRTGDEASRKACEKARDVNRDRLVDLVCTFKVRATGLTKGDRTATLKGRTSDGRPIIGHDAVKVRW